ncbi:DUF1629 domain-containing protein [Stenotrophomonas sp. S48]|uniref:DUF1629 domain-containing protein n=1 Tax=unclassified Stenotrophomonas TaxID=196198 RepID=UPI00190042F2|nr:MULTISPECIES: DUF1629 domain-containing protein [unclassified Stenotrophomonas]MBK0025020.1 DUF1629 domain-containing protein [Stenotrophomonas sp. S48]MBK0046724.1 DUF1629 domain-containing protein [Stenotrophomonas sp. S49]
MEQMSLNGPELGLYYLFAPDLESRRAFRGAEFDNEQELLTPPRLIVRPEKGGFPALREKPRIIFDASKGPAPRDLEGGFSGYWLVSERLHRVMNKVDPGAFEFAECEVRLPDGAIGPRYYLCDVVRELDALDESASKLDIEVDEDFVNGKFYSIAGGAKLTFRSEAVADAHVFLTPFSTFVIADRTFVDAVRSAGVPGNSFESGISFIDAADI